jgi:hypothetical protein
VSNGGQSVRCHVLSPGDERRSDGVCVSPAKEIAHLHSVPEEVMEQMKRRGMPLIVGLGLFVAACSGSTSAKVEPPSSTVRNVTTTVPREPVVQADAACKLVSSAELAAALVSQVGQPQGTADNSPNDQHNAICQYQTPSLNVQVSLLVSPTTKIERDSYDKFRRSLRGSKIDLANVGDAAVLTPGKGWITRGNKEAVVEAFFISSGGNPPLVDSAALEQIMRLIGPRIPLAG